MKKKLKKENDEELEKSEIIIQEKIKEGIDEYKNKKMNNIKEINNMVELNEDQLQSNIELINEQKAQFQNAVKEMKNEIIKEMNIKYSNILQEKIKEIHKSIYENIQKQNQTILEQYIKKYENLESEREQEGIKLSQIIIQDKDKNKNDKNINFSKCNTVHNNVKCQQCFVNPIIGYRYKCTECEDYNLCEKCEEKNEENQQHPHDFIKIKYEEKDDSKSLDDDDDDINCCESDELSKKLDLEELKKNNSKGPYSCEILDKKLDFYISNNSKIEIIYLTIRNNCKFTWPENQTILKCDTDNSLVCFDDVKLSPLKSEQHEYVKIELKIPDSLPEETYKVYMNLNVNGNNCGEEMVINAIIVPELIAFRKQYSLEEDSFSDQDILDALKKNRNWEEAYNYLFNGNDN